MSMYIQEGDIYTHTRAKTSEVLDEKKKEVGEKVN